MEARLQSAQADVGGVFSELTVNEELRTQKAAALSQDLLLFHKRAKETGRDISERLGIQKARATEGVEARAHGEPWVSCVFVEDVVAS